MKPISRKELRESLWPTTDPDYRFKISSVCNNIDYCSCCNVKDCELRTHSVTWTTITWSGNLFCVIDQKNDITTTSPDGITWTTRSKNYETH